jgi:hypothetical protein
MGAARKQALVWQVRTVEGSSVAPPAPIPTPAGPGRRDPSWGEGRLAALRMQKFRR